MAGNVTADDVLARVVGRFDLRDVRIIRRGMNLVAEATDTAGLHQAVRISASPIESDVTRIESDPAGLARWMRDHGVAAPEPLTGTIHVDGHVVTRWHWAERDDSPTTVRDVGAAVHALHRIGRSDLDVAGFGPVPWCGESPWLAIDDRLDHLHGQIPTEWHDALSNAWSRLSGWEGAARSQPQVLVHGDVQPGNIGVGAGKAVLLDWDLVSVGPAAFDHAPLLTWTDRCGEQAKFGELLSDCVVVQ
jgi:aminoglycoside phosphotransferase (APT) family kinase protein